MQVIRIYYISLSGNTTNFLERLDHYLQKELQEKLDYVNVKDLVKNNESLGFEIKEPYFAFLPAYLEGGNGVTTGNTEILTTPLRRLIAYKKIVNIVWVLSEVVIEILINNSASRPTNILRNLDFQY